MTMQSIWIVFYQTLSKKILVYLLLSFILHRLTKGILWEEVATRHILKFRKTINITTSTWWVQRSFFFAVSMTLENIKMEMCQDEGASPLKLITFLLLLIICPRSSHCNNVNKNIRYFLWNHTVFFVKNLIDKKKAMMEIAANSNRTKCFNRWFFCVISSLCIMRIISFDIYLLCLWI